MTRRSKRRQAGVTLIELVIAITLVSAISGGMLMAMRTSLLTLEKTNARLQFNRRVMGVEQIMSRQIGGLMPVTGSCPGPVFAGTPQTLRMVSSYSMAEGARGEPRILIYQVVPGQSGGFRLIVNEFLYSGPLSTTLLCLDAAAQVTPQTFVLADRLAFCNFSYRESVPDSVISGNWVQAWSRPNLPAAVHIEMRPIEANPSRLPLVSVTVPIHITRDIGAPYNDAP